VLNTIYIGTCLGYLGKIQVLCCRAVLYFHLLISDFFSNQDSEESEEEEGLTEEELKQTEAYKSMVNYIKIFTQKQSV